MLAASPSSHLSSTPLALSPPPHSINSSYRASPRERERERGRGRSREKKDLLGHGSQSISPLLNPKVSPYSATIDETEVETNIYFPTFARRSSNPARLEAPRRPYLSSRTSLAMAGQDEEDEDNFSYEEEVKGRPLKEKKKFNGFDNTHQDHDDIFELDAEDDSMQYKVDFSLPLPLSPRRTEDGESIRRASDQSGSSTSTNDLNMVWDEEDGYSEDAESELIQSPPSIAPNATATIIRQNSVTSRIARSPASPKWNTLLGQDAGSKGGVATAGIPTLSFARKIRRPSETAVSPTNKHWQQSATAANTSPSSQGKSPDTDRFKMQSPRWRAPATTVSSPASPRVDAATYHSQSSTLTRSGSSSVKQEGFNPLPSPSQMNVLGRKRSNTDPFANKWKDAVAAQKFPLQSSRG